MSVQHWRRNTGEHMEEVNRCVTQAFVCRAAHTCAHSLSLGLSPLFQMSAGNSEGETAFGL